MRWLDNAIKSSLKRFLYHRSTGEWKEESDELDKFVAYIRALVKEIIEEETKNNGES